MKSILVTLILLGAGPAGASAQFPSPYAGEECNEIKSLTPDEVSGLLQGMGMGFAKAAELNHYPGPRHVLDLSEQLQLSDQQLSQTSQLFEKMREKAVGLGTQLVEYERRLDTLFSAESVSASELDSLLLKIGETRAKLRGVHLRAHLEMKKILSPHQVTAYGNLRGYLDSAKKHRHSH